MKKIQSGNFKSYVTKSKKGSLLFLLAECNDPMIEFYTNDNFLLLGNMCKPTENNVTSAHKDLYHVRLQGALIKDIPDFIINILEWACIIIDHESKEKTPLN